jgi:uncharacterized membrane-anchored protein
MSRFALTCVLLGLVFTTTIQAQDAPDAAATDEAPVDPAQAAYAEKIRALGWVVGPQTVPVGKNSTIDLPERFLYLDEKNTAKWEELNENLSSGREVMIAPETLEWTAYFVFEDEGYVKDDDKIDAPAILKSLQDGTEAANDERKRRGWAPLHVTGWNIPPAYNSQTKRLEWATLLESEGSEATNFFTKILGRRGYTSVVLVANPQRTQAAVAQLNTVLDGYKFSQGETYAEWVPGDKVAQYGLTGLIVGGAAAAAVKTGLFKGLWKFIVIGVVALGGLARSLFKRKSQTAETPESPA